MVRTLAFQVGNTGSIPVRSTKFMSRYQSDLMAPPAKRLIRRFESYSGLQIRPISLMEEQLFCNQLMAVRFCHGAPSFCR